MGWAPIDGWKWIFGLLGMAWVFLGSRSRSTARGAKPTIAARLGGLVVGTWLVRQAVVTPGFFQHVGRGADWICLARDRSGQPYGPGFFEVFGWTSEIAPTQPDRALFQAQALLGAFVPAFAWLIVRFAGGRALVAWVFAILVALHPALASAAASESYYATCTFFLFAAGATLAVATHGARPRSRSTWIGALAAGLLLAQAIAIHPICWLQAACVPLVVAVGSGPLRRRLTTFAIAALACAAAAGAQLWVLLHAGLRSQDGNMARLFVDLLLHRRGIVIPLTTLAIVGVIIARMRRGPRDRLRVAVLGGVASLQLGLQLVGLLDLPAAGGHSHAFLAAPAVFASGAALIHTRPGALRFARAFGAVAALILLAMGPRMVPLTTESLESNWLAGLRSGLPANAIVLFVTERDVIEMKLPFYGACGLPGPRPYELHGGEPLPFFPSEEPLLYYRSSLCSTPAGRPLCEARERGFAMTPLGRTRLPARSRKVKLSIGPDGIPRIEPMRYLDDTVEVVLFRVDGVGGGNGGRR